MPTTDPETSASWAEEAPEDAARRPSPSRLSVADVLTLGNAVCGFSSIYFITTSVLVPYLTEGRGDGTVRHGAATAVMLILMASLFDLCDGLVARRFRSSGMGAELDNLSDLISFGLSPAYFVVVWGLVNDGSHLGLVVAAAVAVLLGGLLRLARFSITTMQDGMFQGMPIPFAALTVVSIVLLELPFAVTLAAVVGVAWLMVSRVEYPKPTGKLAIAAVGWAAVNIGCLVAWAANVPGAETLLVTGCVLQLTLAAVLPLFATVRRINSARQAFGRGKAA
ncbi:CDP-diacylglycerol--serine O-phosphatidyltransferase [Streptomyces libani]|uniref:CDP-diacylglycerol--serine O-phosphatidyltransferase n=2 Tax=Streptomyces nigrescens TaxID=1920 RepID=A0ABY7IFK1_STRNI|nr:MULTISPECIES: CDP-diacylglycerol--serine O-phosphatidyltransferase [Streptomyces]MCX5445932.1 CDP-diacylglycerol--serine O-phosphatidyltransferase [Streptomyces libani]MYX11113.1 CDP-diacylglycerol--serine O-phosphatidyltransferase [Streptomyces sp. SID8375]WAT97547.1 CDP-diacylglycerol--serine O-phosphatidyltransferase [Streptomyces libani subsp. libani]WAU05488.1 CDP-diacylglycerol--serine O-phosphatidyltransferase [Streptomyces nigrescens]WDT56709.1 CDP-diacylglycerol--serine O-phosphati